jgi:hypothetical protein
MTKQISTLADAERALVSDPKILGWASSAAATLCFKAVKLHGEFAIDDQFHTTLHAELEGYRGRLLGVSPAERLLIALEAVAHFEGRLAEVEKGLDGHREKHRQIANDARFAPLKAQMASQDRDRMTAPVHDVLRQIEEAVRDARAELSHVGGNAVDLPVVAEVLEGKFREAVTALRTLRTRKAA